MPLTPSSAPAHAGRLSGKIAFITGIASGQGRAAALLFAREGAIVVGCDINAEAADETVRLARAEGNQVISFGPVDLSDAESATNWIERGVMEFGGIDILYNNASKPIFGPIGRISPSDWSFTLRNELDLLLWTTQAAWPHLIRRGGGAIINTASIAGVRGDVDTPFAAHVAAKGGVIAFTRQIAAEGASHRIRANTITPGQIATPALRGAVQEGAVTRLPMPLGRLGRPEDIAYLALYLASDEAEWMTGSDIVIDGGVCGFTGVPLTEVSLDMFD
jgi:meso-butanediol dehydrogenase/(S,S)-butanediol dehydrogenase/diacetyl reductase